MIEEGTAGRRVLFEDKFPLANWGHPAVIRIVDEKGKLIREMKTQLPPKGLAAAPVIDGTPFAEPKRAEFNLSDFKGTRKVKEPARYFALLINGQADVRHWNDTAFLYRTLTQIYGYSKKNIVVADSASRETSPDLDGDKESDIEFESTVAGLEKAIAKLADTMKKGDQLIVAVNDHGVVENGESVLLLYDKPMGAKAFTTQLRRIPTARQLFIYGQCFSGGFVRPSLGLETVAMAAATNDEFSWGTEDLMFDEFMYHLISAFAGQTHDGKPLRTDLNRDGKVSAKEAFAFALARDKTEESPLLEATQNSSMAQNIGLGF